jgi:hypothetical protein
MQFMGSIPEKNDSMCVDARCTWQPFYAASYFILPASYCHSPRIVLPFSPHRTAGWHASEVLQVVPPLTNRGLDGDLQSTSNPEDLKKPKKGSSDFRCGN